VILYLVRHGETDSNRQGLALGRDDIELNDLGVRQVERLAEALTAADISAVYSSPLARTLRTAEAIAGRHGLRVQSKPGLIEMDIGEAEGLTFAEVRRRFPGLLETWVSDRGPESPMPGGERLVDVQKRAWEVVQSLRALHPEETVCAVTHNFVILTVLASALGVDLAGFRRFRHSVAAITELEVRPDRVRVRRMNDVCHLAGLS
jgi:broad specificity phosphatase PhoE